MDWKTDANLLAVKIHKRIEANGEVSYSELEQIAINKNIDLNVFDTAITRLHRSKKVTQRTKGDDILYKAVLKPKKKTRPAKECLVTINAQSSPYFGAVICPLSDFKKEDDTLYRYAAVVSPGFGTNRIWFCPTDIGLPKNDLPLPTSNENDFKMPFPEIDYSHIFLRPDELLEYKAAAKGMPAYMMKRIHQ